jgi:hypothetical protein
METTDLIQGKKFGGEIIAEVIRDRGFGPEVIERRHVKNTVVNDGKEQLLRMIAGLNGEDFKFFRIGTSGAAVVSNQSNVLSPVPSSLREATTAARTLLSGTRTLQLVISYQSGSGTTTGGVLSAAGIDEVAVLNTSATPGGSALMRAVFTEVNKTKADKLKITYNLRVT